VEAFGVEVEERGGGGGWAALPIWERDLGGEL
jgi:hypothetical protein